MELKTGCSKILQDYSSRLVIVSTTDYANTLEVNIVDKATGNSSYMHIGRHDLKVMAEMLPN